MSRTFSPPPATRSSSCLLFAPPSPHAIHHSRNTQDEGRYAQFLTSIILQGVLALLEPSVSVSARGKDKAVVERAVQDAAAQYKEISGREVKVSVDGSLSDDSAGGVRLASGSGRITLDNTLDERLRLLEDSVRALLSPPTHRHKELTCGQMLPEIRHDLFGANENRKFYT
jgi:V-type H+-transporting ATPase subunit E